MNTEKYWLILIHHAIPSVKRLINNGFICQKDNDPKQTLLKVKSYLEQKKFCGCSSYEMSSSKSKLEYHRVFVGLIEPKKGWKATQI